MSSLEETLKLLTEKVDRILSLLEAPPAATRQRRAAASAPKRSQLNSDEIAGHQRRFEALYETWDAGEELQVEKELGAMNVDELRQFADANNLNVTSKTTKPRILQLISGRFRERRQLMRSHFNRRPAPE